MSSEKTSCPFDRRQFLGRVGCLSCLAAPYLVSRNVLASQDAAAGPIAPSAHKFKDDSQFSFERAFGFTYAESLLPQLRAISDEIGRERMIKILQSAAETKALQSGKKRAEGVPKPDLSGYIQWARKPNRFWEHVLTFGIVEDTRKSFEIKVTECLWAKTFRQAGGEDVGYAVICHPDFANARGYSKHLRLVRSKTLMQGHDCCNLRWLWEAA